MEVPQMFHRGIQEIARQSPIFATDKQGPP
jgi:hypothetical protein